MSVVISRTLHVSRVARSPNRPATGRASIHASQRRYSFCAFENAGAECRTNALAADPPLSCLAMGSHAGPAACGPYQLRAEFSESPVLGHHSQLHHRPSAALCTACGSLCTACGSLGTRPPRRLRAWIERRVHCHRVLGTQYQLVLKDVRTHLLFCPSNIRIVHEE